VQSHHKSWENKESVSKLLELLIEKHPMIVMNDWVYLTNLCQALINSDVINHKEQVLKFFKNPNQYRRHYVVWNELGCPTDDTAETWNMFKDAILNTEKENFNGQQT